MSLMNQGELYSTSTVCILSVVDKVKKETTPEVKKKLYDTIGYRQSGADAIYPKEVALFWLHFVIIMLMVNVNVRSSSNGSGDCRVSTGGIMPILPTVIIIVVIVIIRASYLSG